MADIPASRPSTSFSYSKMTSRRSHQREQNLQIWSEASFCLIFVGQTSYPAKTINEDIFPIENGDFQKITWEKKNIFVRGNRPREKTKKRGWLTGCELSLLLFDPVPGDLLTIAQLDLLRLTNTTASFACLHSCKLTNRHGSPPFWWYLPGKMVIFMGYVSFREGSCCFFKRFSMEHYHQTH